MIHDLRHGMSNEVIFAPPLSCEWAGGPSGAVPQICPRIPARRPGFFPYVTISASLSTVHILLSTHSLHIIDIVEKKLPL